MRAAPGTLGRALVLALVGAGASCNGPSEPPPPPPPSTVVVSGVVSEGGSASAVAGATVSVGAFQTTSASDGSYELRDLSTGAREIRAEADGFETYTTTLDLEAGENRHDIAMARLRLGSLSGVVVADETDDPVADVVVRVTGAQSAEATSGPDGSYQLSDLPLGTVEVRVEEDGFNPYLDSLAIQEGANEYDVRLPPQTLYEWGAFALYLPAEVETVKGVYFYVAGSSFDTGDIIRYAATGFANPDLGPAPPHIEQFWRGTLPALAREHGLAVMGVHPPGIEPSDVFPILPAFAVQTGHPELAGAALLPVGYSFGGRFISQLAAEHPGRIIGFQVNRGSGSVPVDDEGSAGALRSVPGMFINAENDEAIGPLTRADIEAVFKENREAGALWSLAVYPGGTHAITALDRQLLEDWLDPVLEARLPEEHAAGSPIELREVDETAGWLGNRETAEIAEHGAYTADPAAAAWLPSQEAAEAWQAIVSLGVT